MSNAFQPVIFRPLPRPLIPFPDETLASYWSRLAEANHTPVDRLKIPSRWLRPPLESAPEVLRRLTVLTGQAPQSLWRRLPELRWWDEQGYRAVPGSARRERRWVCRRCAAAHAPGQRIQAWIPASHHHVCTRHGLWTGKSVHYPNEQVDLARLPGVVRAQRLHLRLLRRHGVELISECLHTCQDLWRVIVAHHFTSARHDLYDIVRKQPGARSGWGPGLYAMAYPAVVTMMSMAATPHWRSVLAHDMYPHNVERFLSEYQRRLPPNDPLHRRNALRTIGSQSGSVMRHMHLWVERQALTGAGPESSTDRAVPETVGDTRTSPGRTTR